MGVFRVNRTENYTTISNYHLKDKNLSLKAKGLLSMMFSLPDDWDYSVRGLQMICKETKDTINGGIRAHAHKGQYNTSRSGCSLG